MGPEGLAAPIGKFTERVPPSFDGCSSYATYCSDVALWTKLTSLDADKHGPALVGQLSGEAKHSANNIPVDLLCSKDGASKLIAHLDESFAVDASDKLDIDLADFLSFTWDRRQTVEQYIIGFNARLDKISEVNLTEKVKGHMLLRQANLSSHDRSMIIGASSGNFELRPMCAALRTSYRDRNESMIQSSDSHHSHERSDQHTQRRRNPKKFPPHSNHRHPNSDIKSMPANDESNAQGTPIKPIFMSTFNNHEIEKWQSAIIDTGACASIVGKNTLDKFMTWKGIHRLTNHSASMPSHKFGDHSEEHQTICGVRVPFSAVKSADASLAFDIAFDVIKGDLPFLIGLPSLAAMAGTINFNQKTLGFKLHGSYHRFSLVRADNHLYLPFELCPIPTKEHKLHVHNKNAVSFNPGFYSVHLEHDDQAKYASTNYTHSSKSQSTTEGAYYLSPPEGTSDKIDVDTKVDLNNSVMSYQTSETACHSTENSDLPSSSTLSKGELQKLHKQLRHASVSASIQYLRSAGMWRNEYRPILEHISSHCACNSANGRPHAAQASMNPPRHVKQRDIALDIVYLGRKNYLHIIDRCTGWSVTGHIPSKALSCQIDVLHLNYTLKHGPPSSILGDQEYNKPEFLRYCEDIEATFHPVAAFAHNSNGAVERANRTLREYFNRLSAANRQMPIDSIVQEATFGKNICKGGKLASSFELLYNQVPRLIRRFDDTVAKQRCASPSENAMHVGRKRVQQMLHAPHHPLPDVSVGDLVLFWRDSDGWLGPATVTKTQPHVVTLRHDGYTKTAGPAHIKRYYPPPFANSLNPSPVNEPALNLTDEDSDSEWHPPEMTNNNGSPPIEGTSAPKLDGREATTESEIGPESTDIETPRLTGMQKEAQRLALEGDQFIERMNTREREYSNDEHHSTDDNKNFISPLPHASKPPNNPITAHEKKHSYAAEKDNWVKHKAFKVVSRSSVPKGSNIIGSHVVYKRKTTGTVKGRIVPWGHRDKEKDEIRGDAPCLNLDIFRLLLSLSAEHKWDIKQMDAVAAYLQALGFDRVIYIYPPAEENTSDLWLLTAAAYGLKDSGRLWYLTSNASLVHKYGLSRSQTEYAAYFKHCAQGNLALLVVTQVDNYLYTGYADEIRKFESFLQNEFNIGELDENVFETMGSDVSRENNGTIHLSQKRKMEELDLRPLSSLSSNRKGSEPASPKDHTAYKSMIGQLLFVGRVSYPPLQYHASHMASKTSALQVHHLRDIMAVVTHSRRTIPQLLFSSEFDPSRPSELVAFSDAALCGKKEEGGRAGFIIVRMQGDIIHPISWSARKLKRVARSSSTAELLGAADAVSHLLYLSSVIKEIIGARHSPSTRLVIDSHCLYRLCSTTNDPRESLNKIDLSAIREAFRPGSLDAISWQPGCYHIADALTKDNRVTSLLLMKALADGQHPPHPSSQTTLSSAACPLTVDGSVSSQPDVCDNEDDCPSSMIRDDSSEHEPRSDSMLQ